MVEPAQGPYATVIGPETSPVNRALMAWVQSRIVAPYLDVGCNGGWLLRIVPGGVGVDRSPIVLRAAEGLPVACADACALPFRPAAVATCVLATVLEHVENALAALAEAERVAARVVGMTPWPGRSAWGTPGGTPWVRSVLAPEALGARGYEIEDIPGTVHYGFFRDG